MCASLYNCVPLPLSLGLSVCGITEEVVDEIFISSGSSWP